MADHVRGLDFRFSPTNNEMIINARPALVFMTGCFMSLIKLAIKHGQTADQAQQRLRTAVADVSTRFAPLIERVQWATDGRTVDVIGRGFDIQMNVDEQDVHVAGNIELLGKLLGTPLLTGIKGILQNTFQKRLT